MIILDASDLMDDDLEDDDYNGSDDDDNDDDYTPALDEYWKKVWLRYHQSSNKNYVWAWNCVLLSVNRGKYNWGLF